MSQSSFQLEAILQALNLPPLEKMPSWPLTHLCHNSEEAHPSSLFVVLPGHTFSTDMVIEKALQKGVQVIISAPSSLTAPYFITVDDPWSYLQPLYALFYPHLPCHRIAVTGTNGKSSFVSFFYQLCQKMGIPAASLGTLGLRSSSPICFPYKGLTTFSRTATYDLLKACFIQGIHHVAFEASSEALQQRRLEPLTISTGVFTSFSQDHLDYHITEEAYWQAKCRLFTHYSMKEGIIYNSLPKKLSPLSADLLFYGPHGKAVQHHKNATYRILSQTLQGQTVDFSVNGFSWRSFIPLSGFIQVENILASVCALWRTGIPLKEITPHLETLSAVDGRMEYHGTFRGGHVFIDYAHTPDSLLKALQSLRTLVPGRVIVVFGCGGNRDRKKRPMMGSIAHILSDKVILTDDNPRFEDPSSIRYDIKQECPQAEEIVPREEAIAQGLLWLEEGDALLIAGKGHETTQILGSTTVSFSDAQWVRYWIDFFSLS